MIKKLDHLVLTTTDFTKCTSFYDALGFSVKNAGARFELYSGDFKINVHLLGQELEPKAMNIQPGSADLCFEIDTDIEAFRKELAKKNISIELDVVERNGRNGRMKSVYLRDPDGNLIEFCSYCE